MSLKRDAKAGDDGSAESLQKAAAGFVVMQKAAAGFVVMQKAAAGFVVMQKLAARFVVVAEGGCALRALRRDGFLVRRETCLVGRPNIGMQRNLQRRVLERCAQLGRDVGFDQGAMNKTRP